MSFKDLITKDGKKLEIPFLQGGMGVGVSLGSLAGHVARLGGMGTISTADTGYLEPDFAKNPAEANLRALTKEIAKAKEISDGNGLVAINAMVATQQFDDAVRTAVAAGVDAVVSGAGLPMNLPELVPEGASLIAPIVSGGRAAALILKSWQRRYHRFPDFVVLEGSKAGGHLGFKEEDLLAGTCRPLPELVKEVKEVLSVYEDACGRAIPLFAAGGIFDRNDIAEVMAAGADGVQMATRLITTYECDASDRFKQVLLDAKAEDVRIIHSPVGMPGRAVLTPLLSKVENDGRVAPDYCWHCIKTCEPGKVPYCITKALVEAVKGNYEEGLFFCGSNVGRLDRIYHLDELFAELGLLDEKQIADLAV